MLAAVLELRIPITAVTAAVLRLKQDNSGNNQGAHMRIILFALLIGFTVSLGGCTTFLMKDCQNQGQSQYWHCKQVHTIF
jgi:hypothetical protein